MSFSYHTRKGISTPFLILLISIVIVVIAAGVIVFLGQERMAEESTIEADLPIIEEASDAENVEIDSRSEIEEEITQEGTESGEEDETEPLTEELPDTSDNTPVEEVTAETLELSGTVLAGNASPILDFNQPDYEAALASDKLVLLYFYANWCPICKTEVNTATYPAFDALEQSNVVGFRVNFNDNQTDSFEKDLAREFGVAYQHTKVFLKNGERILKSPESWSLNRYLEEISNVTN